MYVCIDVYYILELECFPVPSPSLYSASLFPDGSPVLSMFLYCWIIARSDVWINVLLRSLDGVDSILVEIWGYIYDFYMPSRTVVENTQKFMAKKSNQYSSCGLQGIVSCVFLRPTKII